MGEQVFYRFVAAWTALAVLLFPLLLKISIPYGRYARKGWGLLISS